MGFLKESLGLVFVADVRCTYSRFLLGSVGVLLFFPLTSNGTGQFPVPCKAVQSVEDASLSP